MPCPKSFCCLLALGVLLLATACRRTSSVLTGQPGQPATTQKSYVIRDVNVIPMTAGGAALPNATVVILDGKIASINGPVPAGAEVIDGRGKWLIPGLIDMHVHIPTDGHFNTTYPTRAAAIFTGTQDIMTPFVANGVTTVLDLNSRAGHFGQRNEILRGDVVGPRIALAAMINGGDESGRMANTPVDGRQAVRMARAEGYEFIKVYSKLGTEVFEAIVDEAHKQGMKVVGHIPNAFGGNKDGALLPHFGMVAHAEEFFKQNEDFTEEDARRYARLAKQNGIWLSPTLIVIGRTADQARSLDSVRALPGFRSIHPLLQSKWLTANGPNQGTSPARIARLQKMMVANQRLVKAFREADVPIVAGTDAGSSGVIWGYSLHDELELLVAAGLTPEEALRSATLLPAVWLGMDSLVGTVETGKLADLVLLDASPLVSIGNTRKIAGVFVNGRWLSRKTIGAMLSDLSKHNVALQGRYEWKNRAAY